MSEEDRLNWELLILDRELNQKLADLDQHKKRLIQEAMEKKKKQAMFLLGVGMFKLFLAISTPNEGSVMLYLLGGFVFVTIGIILLASGVDDDDKQKIEQEIEKAKQHVKIEIERKKRRVIELANNTRDSDEKLHLQTRESRVKTTRQHPPVLTKVSVASAPVKSQSLSADVVSVTSEKKVNAVSRNEGQSSQSLPASTGAHHRVTMPTSKGELSMTLQNFLNFVRNLSHHQQGNWMFEEVRDPRVPLRLKNGNIHVIFLKVVTFTPSTISSLKTLKKRLVDEKQSSWNPPVVCFVHVVGQLPSTSVLDSLGPLDTSISRKNYGKKAMVLNYWINAATGKYLTPNERDLGRIAQKGSVSVLIERGLLAPYKVYLQDGTMPVTSSQKQLAISGSRAPVPRYHRQYEVDRQSLRQFSPSHARNTTRLLPKRQIMKDLQLRLKQDGFVNLREYCAGHSYNLMAMITFVDELMTKGQLGVKKKNLRRFGHVIAILDERSLLRLIQHVSVEINEIKTLTNERKQSEDIKEVDQQFLERILHVRKMLQGLEEIARQLEISLLVESIQQWRVSLHSMLSVDEATISHGT